MQVTTAAASAADGSGAFACDLRLEQAPFTIVCTVPDGLVFAPVVPPPRDAAPAPRPGGRVVRYDFAGRLPSGVRVPYDPTAFLDVDDWDELPRLDAVRIALPLTAASASQDRWVTVDLALLGERTVVLPNGTDSVTVRTCAARKASTPASPERVRDWGGRGRSLAGNWAMLQVVLRAWATSTGRLVTLDMSPAPSIVAQRSAAVNPVDAAVVTPWKAGVVVRLLDLVVGEDADDDATTTRDLAALTFGT